MIGISESQLMAWLSPIIWPFLRTLAMFTAAPVFSQKAIPMRVKVGLAFLVAVCAQAVLDQPIVAVNSPQALTCVIQQVGIGLAIGFSARLIIAVMELAGEAIGLQMGLSFASFFDPTSGAQLSAVSRFLVQIFTLFFIVVNGHLIVLMAVIKSFDAFPVDGSFLQAVAQMRIHELGSAVFSSALWIALPLVALLLFVNLTMGVIARIAPQLNVFSIGFPVTLTVGMLGITATLPMMEQPFLSMIERTLSIFGV